MIVKRHGRITEFIPSPQGKLESLVRDHSFNLIIGATEWLTEFGFVISGFLSPYTP